MAEITKEDAAELSRRFRNAGMSVTAQMVLDAPGYFTPEWAKIREEEHARHTAAQAADERMFARLRNSLNGLFSLIETAHNPRKDWL